MTACSAWMLLVPLGLLAAAPAGAADDAGVRVVPQAGFRMGGGLEDAATGAARDLQDGASVGLALEWRVDDADRWAQVWYSRQATRVRTPDAGINVTVQYLHLGGTVPLSEAGRVHSYFAAGIGAARLTPAGPGLSDATEWSGSMGVGMALPLSPRLALRVEARGYVTLVDPDTAIFCRVDNGNGACTIVASGRTLFQAELTVGLSCGF